jgi:hypothetical protein
LKADADADEGGDDDDTGYSLDPGYRHDDQTGDESGNSSYLDEGLKAPRITSLLSLCCVGGLGSSLGILCDVAIANVKCGIYGRGRAA